MQVNSPPALKMDSSWAAHLQAEAARPYMRELRAFLLERKKRGAIIYPKGEDYFTAFNLTPLEKTRVVILGQDPYHGPNQAHGLCFSVRHGVAVPPSLLNIYKEIAADLGCPMPTHGCLENWAKQGVLLLNSVLTVEAGRAGAHQGKGWERFTDRVIDILNREREGVVFMLWGSYAQKKGQFIDRHRHLVLTAPHPSPLSASRGFFGCRHFSKANGYIQSHGGEPINWCIGD